MKKDLDKSLIYAIGLLVIAFSAYYGKLYFDDNKTDKDQSKEAKKETKTPNKTSEVTQKASCTKEDYTNVGCNGFY